MQAHKVILGFSFVLLVTRPFLAGEPYTMPLLTCISTMFASIYFDGVLSLLAIYCACIFGFHHFSFEFLVKTGKIADMQTVYTIAIIPIVFCCLFNTIVYSALKDTLRKLNSQHQQLDMVSKAKTTFLSVIGHEIRYFNRTLNYHTFLEHL